MHYAAPLAFLFLLWSSAPVSAQDVDFECQTPNVPFPTLGVGPFPSANCEGVAFWPGSVVFGSASTVTTPACGFPTSLFGYARVEAGDFPGPGAISGGLLVRPVVDPYVSELLIPAPTGATGVSFHWGWNNEEGFANAGSNDGFDVSLVDASGALILRCVYGDTFDYGFGCTGPNFFSGGTGPVPAGSYLSVVVYDGGDDCCGANIFRLDAVCFESGPRLTMFAPFGSGTLQLIVDCGTPSDYVFTPISVSAGAFPNGYFFGIDISIFELMSQFQYGPPFFSYFGSDGYLSYGPFGGAPSGLTLYAVPIDDLGSSFPRAGYPVAFTIP